MGSSPRVRGKPHVAKIAPQLERLIPARAGKTQAAPLLKAFTPAHPRACGENPNFLAVDAKSEGSSPRVRGKQMIAWKMPPMGGLIPARAGKTRSMALLLTALRAHPRACGENLSSSSSAITAVGSSPRVRGKLYWAANRMGSKGLIPARAGKTGTPEAPK